MNVKFTHNIREGGGQIFERKFFVVFRNLLSRYLFVVFVIAGNVSTLNLKKAFHIY